MNPIILPEYATNQQIFDAVWNHFITQNKPIGMDERGCSRYRSIVDGQECGCAIGIFLTDDQARTLDKECFGGCSIEALLSMDPHKAASVVPAFIYNRVKESRLVFLFCLQKTHDRWVRMKNLNRKYNQVEDMTALARVFDLDVPLS